MTLLWSSRLNKKPPEVPSNLTDCVTTNTDTRKLQTVSCYVLLHNSTTTSIYKIPYTYCGSTIFLHSSLFFKKVTHWSYVQNILSLLHPAKTIWSVKKSFKKYIINFQLTCLWRCLEQSSLPSSWQLPLGGKALLLFQEEPDTFLLPHRASLASLEGAVQLAAMVHWGEMLYAANTARNNSSTEKLLVYVILM